MKNRKFLVAFACLGMALAACTGPKPTSEPSSDPSSPSSAAPSSVSSSSKPSSSKSSAEPPHVHNFQEVTAENGDDYKVMECVGKDAKYLVKAVADAESESTGTADKFGKGQFFTFKFTLKKNYKVNFQIGLKISSSSHTSRKFQTYAEGASTDDKFESNPENDGTQRYWLELNGNSENRVEVTNTQTYGDNGMNTDDYTEVILVDSMNLKAGENLIKFCSHTQTGYRLYVGGEVRLGVIEESDPTPGDAHNLQPFAHEKGEGEVPEEIKKCSDDEYYEISWDAQTTDGATSSKFSNGKLSSGGYVEYKVWSPKAMTARLYTEATPNTEENSHYDRVAKTGKHSIWYCFYQNQVGYKVKLTVNGTEVDQSKQTIKVGSEDVSFQDFTYSDVNYPEDTGGAFEFPWVEVDLVEGANTIRIDRNQGYGHTYSKFIFRGEASNAPAADGYTVKFITEHCKVFVFEDQDYTVEPVEATSALTRDENGVICKYSPADPTNNVEEVKPQMNFKVVCDNGYEVDTTCFTLSGEEGKEWNNLKDISDGVFRITTIKDDVDVTIKAAAAGTLKAGYTAEFVTEHCTVKVYTEKGFKAEDTATPYMSRNKTKADDGTYPYCKGENAQLSFEVIPEEGYEFVSGLDVGAEAESDVIEFIAPSGYNKIKRSAENRYNLTKVSRNLVITIKCTEKAEEPEPQVDGTLVKKTVAELKADNNWENEGVVTSFIIGEVVVTLQGSGGDSKYYDNGSNIRIYIAKKADGVDGTGSIKFEGRSLIKVMSVKVTYVWNKSVGTCDLVSGETTVVDAASKTFNITNPSEEKAEQLRITAIEVVYKAVNP